MKRVLLLIMIFSLFSSACFAETKILTTIDYKLKQQPFESVVNLIDNIPYNIRVGTDNGFEYWIKINKEGTEIFNTNLKGQRGKIYLSKTRDNRIDIIILLSGGNSDYLSDLKVIGQLSNGEIGLIKIASSLQIEATGPSIIESNNTLGLQYSPSYLRTKYQIDLKWNQDFSALIPSSPYQVIKQSSLPTYDNELYYDITDLSQPIRFYMSNNNLTINSIHIKKGERILIRPNKQSEKWKTLWSESHSGAVNLQYLDGSFLITGKNKGETNFNLTVFQKWQTASKLKIIVE